MRVRAVRLGSGGARGVETGAGRVWPADAVVANADAAHLLGELLPPGSRRAPSPGPASMSGWTAVLRARRRAGPEARVAHTVLFPRDYMREFEDIFDRNRSPAEPTVYLCAQEACHHRAGWPEEEPVFVMVNAPAGPKAKNAPAGEWDRLRDTVLRRMDGAGLRDADDRVVWERTPTDLAREFPGSRGSLYGAASNGPLAAFRRPPNRLRGVRGVYLASGSAHPGGGVPLCLLSGLAAADALLRDRGRAPLPAWRVA